MYTGSNYQRNLPLTEIAKLIKGKLKQDFPQCKFSVISQYYSMGASLHISLMSSPFKVGEKDYMQLNQYQFKDKSNIEFINNGYKITPQLFYIMEKVCTIAYSYNFDDSDIQTDYFNTNFYLHIYVGQWDKPYKQIN